MSILLLSSPDANAGKTTLAVAIGQRIGRMGKRVSYRRLPGLGAPSDTAFVRSALHLREPPDVISPSAERLDDSLHADVDLLLIEAEDLGGARTIAHVDGVTSLIVARFTADNLAESIVEHAKAIGVDRAQVIINVVPEKGQRQVRQRVIPSLREAGLSVVGVIPQDRILLGTTVAELASALEAEVLCAQDQLDLPVEAVMIAAMSDEGA